MNVKHFWNLFTICFVIILLDIKFSSGQQTTGLSSLATFNFMNCMDFARHMSSTAQRFGLISSPAGEAAAAAAAARRRKIDHEFISSVLSVSLANKIFVSNHHRQIDIRQAPNQGGLVDTFQNLFNQILNIGDSNVAACNQRPKLTVCENIDEYLNSIFPEWWFNLKITDNANYVAGQLTTHRYHALFEAGMKAYKCFCQC